MKYIFTIILLIAVGIQTFNKWIIVFNYEINKDYIAKNLCINRTVPGSCCKGKCYLNKKLAADDDQPKSNSKSVVIKDIQLQLFLQTFSRIDFASLPLINHYNSYYTNSKSQEFISSFFQPPQLLLS